MLCNVSEVRSKIRPRLIKSCYIVVYDKKWEGHHTLVTDRGPLGRPEGSLNRAILFNMSVNSRNVTKRFCGDKLNGPTSYKSNLEEKPWLQFEMLPTKLTSPNS
jgi:hypothetical protein